MNSLVVSLFSAAAHNKVDFPGPRIPITTWRINWWQRCSISQLTFPPEGLWLSPLTFRVLSKKAALNEPPYIGLCACYNFNGILWSNTDDQTHILSWLNFLTKLSYIMLTMTTTTIMEFNTSLHNHDNSISISAPCNTWNKLKTFWIFTSIFIKHLIGVRF